MWSIVAFIVVIARFYVDIPDPDHSRVKRVIQNQTDAV
tara:strand:- start:1 stop:114 length:114 start_codon:yes stop_codon:yes gene_type:complete